MNRDLHAGGARQLVGFPGDECRESEGRVETRLVAVPAHAIGGHHRRRTSTTASCRSPRRTSASALAVSERRRPVSAAASVIGTRWPLASSASSQIRPAKRSLTHCKQNGSEQNAVSGTAPFDGQRPDRVLNCCGVSSWRNASRHCCQKSGAVDMPGEPLTECPAASGTPEERRVESAD